MKLARTNSVSKLKWHNIKRMYERSLNQILHVVRRIRCLTYAMLLVTCTFLLLYLLHDVFDQQKAVFPAPYMGKSHSRLLSSVEGFSATIQVRYLDKCTPQKNIIFTKTHKTGSSTISNILLRYSELYNLTQLLYKYPSSTEYNRLQESKLLRRKANIFAQHASYNMDFLKQHIYNESWTFTILRHPVSQFISAYSFFDKIKQYPAGSFTDSVRRFLQEHKKYLKQNWFCKNCKNLVNNNAIDMGFSVEHYMHSTNKEAFMAEFLKQASDTYDVVLITEYFDLSLVLLKRRLCLRFQDILYLKSLERVKKETVEDPLLLQSISEIQQLDLAIYQHFNKTFWREVEKEENIFEELSEFRRLNKLVQSFCIKGSKMGYRGTLENVLTPPGRDNFYCLGMNTRCLPFSKMLEARDDPAVSEQRRQDILSEPGDPDSLNFHQLLHLDRNVDILKLIGIHEKTKL